ncbi:unnamed protein product [Triticum turgidum subsp. durum]|uniref:Uncharacterized protein n=1 Tax=Triticum turgidum subsp. durum TaxID=4567 RepID=A0A9R0V9U4_TRITD|nr:unnamed protein product [Triticum turgidum subsp. durum]
MHRRFLNVIAQDLNTRANSLYLIDPWKHLFRPPSSTGGNEREAAENTNPEKENRGASMSRLRLHKPRFRFESNLRAKPTHSFSALLRENSLLLAADTNSPFLYDVDLNSVQPIHPMHPLRGPNCVCFSVPPQADDPGGHRHYFGCRPCLYVLDLSPPAAAVGFSFEVLSYRSNNLFSVCEAESLNHNYINSFHWERLPPPPFLADDGACGRRAVDVDIDTCSSMIVDGTTICISFDGVGTYAFDTATGVWTRAGDWALPFHGRAEYVPELGLSFALSADSPDRLCAMDCTVMRSARAGPLALRHTFDRLDLPEEKWSPYKRHLVSLGAGSFCVVSFCKAVGREFAVLTGVEVKPCNNGDGPLRMTKHLSKRWSLGSHRINCVL